MTFARRFATLNSAAAVWRVGARLTGWLGLATSLLAAPPDVPLASFSTNFTASAQNQLLAARKKFATDTNDLTAAWELGRACFWRGEFAASDDERAKLAHEGIAVCRPLVVRAPTLPEGHYYLAMNLGQLARTKWLNALSIVKELERHLELADGLNPRLDHAGPARCLGQLYRDAPGWPVSLGNRTKARTQLLRALELAPDFPENHLNLIESWLEWKEKKRLAADLNALAELLPKARKQFTGEAFAAYWDDWGKRWKDVQKQAAELLKKIAPP